MPKNLKPIRYQCPSCYENKKKENMIFLACGDSFCSGCLVSWILSKIQEPHYQIDEQIQCMITQCRKAFKVQDIARKLSKGSMNAINQALFTIYLMKTTDISRCPAQKCQYAGFIDTSVSCKDYLQCKVCNNQWREKVHYTKLERLKEYWNYSAVWNESLSLQWKVQHSKPCPKCQVPIEKNQGCDHMTCSQCEHEFSWHSVPFTSAHDQAKHKYEYRKKRFFSLFLPVIILFFISLIVLYLIFSLQTLVSWALAFENVCQIYDAIKSLSEGILSLMWSCCIAGATFAIIRYYTGLPITPSQKILIAVILGACCMITY